MAIKVEKESDDTLRGFGGIMEVCVFCRHQTRYWHTRTNNPVCPDCAPVRKVSELKDWGKYARAIAKRMKKQEQTA